jgi:hypothetical protein
LRVSVHTNQAVESLATGRRREEQHPAGAQSAQQLHGQVREQERQPGHVVAGVEVVPGPDESAARRLAELVSPDAVDRMLADAEQAGFPLAGADGLIN